MLDALSWFALCTVTACVEIESKGKNGWASGMPTWHRKIRWSSRPVTDYHLFMFLLPIVFMHIPFFIGLPWTWTVAFAPYYHFWYWRMRSEK